MPSRLPIQRIQLLRPLRPPSRLRPFTQNSLILRSRPELPFLYTDRRRPPARFLTTETKEWLKDEVSRGLKYTAVIYVIIGCTISMGFALRQEWMEHEYPTPSEWTWFSRSDYRTARYMEEKEGVIVDWAKVGIKYQYVLGRLEDPSIDGAGLLEQDEGGIFVEGIGKTGFDISQMSEPWRRSYYGVLMGCARSAEYLDGWVHDTTRSRPMSWEVVADPLNPKIWLLPFPGNTVIGPSNPEPRPIRPGMQSPPKEKDCEPFFEAPEVYYMKILTTKGFTKKQRVEAALSYGLWLNLKGTPETAQEMFKWALDIAASDSPASKSPVNKQTGILDPQAGPPSDNILSSSTAIAIHHAVNSNLAIALPIFVSILRARRALPDPPVSMISTLQADEPQSSLKKAWAMVGQLLKPPVFPPEPSDGTIPPFRDAKERCEEAGVMTYIGEILFSSGGTSKEDGLAWTREAVDDAEVELRKKGIGKEAKQKCQQCLEVGLANWMVMVTKMTTEEKENKVKASNRSGWFGGTEQNVTPGRWQAEEAVVRERMRRAGDLLAPDGW